MLHSRKPLVLLVGAAVAAGSLFSMDTLAHGYMQDAKTTAPKAGEGKCGGEQATAKGGGASVGKANPGKHHTMADMDTDKDGRMSRAEFNSAHEDKTMAHDDWLQQTAKQFADHDVDSDGFITQAEMDKHHAAQKGDAKAATEGKCGEGKCGEGKCGGNP